MRLETDWEKNRDWPKSVCLILALGILAASCLLFWTIASTNIGSQVLGIPASRVGNQPLVSLEQLFFEDVPENLFYETVELRGVAARAVLSDFIFLIGEGGGPFVPVVLRGERMSRQPEDKTEVLPGLSYVVFGTVRPAMQVPALLDKTLSARDRELLMRSEIFIDAASVRPFQTE